MPTLGPATGNRNLIEQIEPRARAAGVLDRLSVVHIANGVHRDAHFAAGPDTEYEIGSLTKTMTSMLFADALTTGALTTDTTAGDLLDLAGSHAASSTLEELASHRAGLPRIASGVRNRIAATVAVLRHRNPYTAGHSQLLAQANAAKISARGKFRYSNLGAALLGQALASHTRTGYADLLNRRLFRPLGMTQSYVPLVSHDLPPDAPTGWNAHGRAEQAWTMHAYAPAGGVRSTPDDMARWTHALLDGTAPGSTALTPRWDADGQSRVGYAWFTDHIDGVDITWHNGATGGFSSMMALDLTHAAAVVVLANTAVPVDGIALSLLLGANSPK